MKFIIILILSVVVLPSYAGKPREDVCQAIRKGLTTRIDLFVVDDDGHGVAGAHVQFVSSRFQESNTTTVQTDLRGKCSVELSTCGHSIEIKVSKQGYYSSFRKLCYIQIGHVHKTAGDKWLPYPTVEFVTLRSMKNPVALSKVGRSFEMPETNVWIGVDMEHGDFVRSGHSGIHPDFDVLVVWDGLPPASSRQCKAFIRFSGMGTGGYYSACVRESTFPYAYEARPEFEPVTTIEVVNRNGDPHDTSVPFRHNSEFITRTRCKVDSSGKVVSASFGSIRNVRISPSWDGKPTLTLCSVFNRNSNDTNLECR